LGTNEIITSGRKPPLCVLYHLNASGSGRLMMAPGQERSAPETGPDQKTTTAPIFFRNDGRACESLPPTLTGAICVAFDCGAPEGGCALAKIAAPD
jgi:hypothetical protein